MPEKILIVDDDLETLRLVGIMLQRQGYQISAASNGAQAISMAKAEMPDLILLDVMMPEMDGNEVAREIRAIPATSTIPILMFTAKTQVEDKIAGYESGADDYLTKPTHPAELTAHIKSLLARTAKVRQTGPMNQKGYLVGVLSAKGGVGVSTITLNLGVALSQRLKTQIAVAEFRPTNGTWGLELGYLNPDGLENLLNCQPGEITPVAMEKELITHGSGVRLLMSSYQPRDIQSINKTEHYLAMLNSLSALSPISIVDLGANDLPGIDAISDQFNEIVLVLDPHPVSATKSKVLIDELSRKGFGKGKFLSIAVVNRLRTDVQLSWSQISDSLGIPVSVIFTPAPELAYQSALRNTPMMLIQPDSLSTQQFQKLAELIAQHAKKV